MVMASVPTSAIVVTKASTESPYKLDKAQVIFTLDRFW